MKNYYYNPKTQDIMIFDTERNEIDVLEMLKGIHVITSSEIREPGSDEPVNHWANSMYNPKDGKAHLDYKGSARRAKSESAYEKELTKAKKRKCGKCGQPGHRSDNCEKFVSESPTIKKKGQSGKWKCKNCGELGHSAKTCKAKVEQDEVALPDDALAAIVQEERALETA